MSPKRIVQVHMIISRAEKKWNKEYVFTCLYLLFLLENAMVKSSM